MGVLSFRSGHSLTEFPSEGRVERSIQNCSLRTLYLANELLSTSDNTTKFCISFLVVHAVLRLPLSVFLVFCEPLFAPRLEVGTALRSELLLVREPDTSHRGQVKVD